MGIYDDYEQPADWLFTLILITGMLVFYGGFVGAGVGIGWLIWGGG